MTPPGHCPMPPIGPSPRPATPDLSTVPAVYDLPPSLHCRSAQAPSASKLPRGDLHPLRHSAHLWLPSPSGQDSAFILWLKWPSPPASSSPPCTPPPTAPLHLQPPGQWPGSFCLQCHSLQPCPARPCTRIQPHQLCSRSRPFLPLGAASLLTNWGALHVQELGCQWGRPPCLQSD